MKQRIQSVAGRPRGGAGRGRQRTHTERCVEATSALTATKRASGAPGVVPVRSRVVFAPRQVILATGQNRHSAGKSEALFT